MTHKVDKVSLAIFFRPYVKTFLKNKHEFWKNYFGLSSNFAQVFLWTATDDCSFLMGRVPQNPSIRCVIHRYPRAGHEEKKEKSHIFSRNL
jgi:hypothetical protein